MIVVMVMTIIITTNITNFCVFRVITFLSWLSSLFSEQVTGWASAESYIATRRSQGLYLYSKEPRLLLVPIQPLIKWYWRIALLKQNDWGMKLATHNIQFFLRTDGAVFSRQTHKHSWSAHVQFFLYFHADYESEYV